VYASVDPRNFFPCALCTTRAPPLIPGPLAQSERIVEVDRIPTRIPVEVEATGDPDGIFLGECPPRRDPVLTSRKSLDAALIYTPSRGAARSY
jgi:hypothetical protein